VEEFFHASYSFPTRRENRRNPSRIRTKTGFLVEFWEKTAPKGPELGRKQSTLGNQNGAEEQKGMQKSMQKQIMD